MSGKVSAESYRYCLNPNADKGQSAYTVVGGLRGHIVAKKETLLDIARNYGLGYNEISLFYPEIDPWIPKEGQSLDIPTLWILPSTVYEEVVINIPEMRLYRFSKKMSMVKTYPIGIGREGFETPIRVAHVVERERNPAWTVPPSAWSEYGKIVVPPGPQNPLGDYWVGLSAEHIGIHGTNRPWGVGRTVSRGCIRLYPEHIRYFFNEVSQGTKVEIIYEPVKFGLRGDIVFAEVHPDIYNKIPDIYQHARVILSQKGLLGHVDLGLVDQCLKKQNGVPVIVGQIREGW